MNISEIYTLFQNFPIVVTDSRKVVKDSIFVALKGDNFNGNKFALSTLENGCSYAIVDEKEYAIDDRFIWVEDALDCLQQLAREHRRVLGIPILAITGTNGKTTTKELVNEVLKKKFKTSATQGNFNNHIGVPLTLLEMNSDTEFGIVEMGANHPGEIKMLCEIAEPNYGLITNVGKAHLEGFGSFEGVKNTKKELYDYLSKHDGEVFVNCENDHLLGMLNKQKIVFYGNSDKAYSKARFLQAEPKLIIELRSPIGKLYIKTQLIGAYNFENVLAAVTLGRYFGIDEIDIKDALETYTPSNNRSQLKKTDNNVLFLDAYNANPTSMKAAIENFAAMKMKNKFLILGDMLELGNESEREHLDLLELLNQNELSDTILVGDIFSTLSSKYKFKTFKTVGDLIIYLDTLNLKDKYILIKGSRGIKLEKAIEKL
ncbi:UDP-N-acetylmuramoyl-tripeptide--D-alanyl-D-alanine ligase [Ancylomarina euxinus]|uniref:UDP-N-acetylmuramoyl-tripeptide--D-alanyl-D-alanine ligase n=1 Tax=Ancylomarina euxinus TaxID=2283627 RepID=A0A425Y5W3_9BACT|nr:UDP-N-acetylmuramoyl-tripeptide--D-alanyl-D-alanine ligase [Ancylomarina euxinus]MCZ4694354.1 UDP-N-acetylmuramoyl-tripeptide--D-alanyl-D-alanine ligase [Ancylomarina euxinus]MUP14315.1 UDP-N-acetylmuramoyl-tripeptide--D-alanyl-D-alanine ligase [Ancylomarina euxinus]RRG23631.1 UDP-N-acetylmuramoyl-tripeptide--D-alanyl-D-alanine ligase [Ancylomarina euxinus]